MSIRISMRDRHAARIILASGFLFLWVVTPLQTAQADEIRLITGLTMKGKIVHEDEDHVVLEGAKGEDDREEDVLSDSRFPEHIKTGLQEPAVAQAALRPGDAGHPHRRDGGYLAGGAG